MRAIGAIAALSDIVISKAIPYEPFEATEVRAPFFPEAPDEEVTLMRPPRPPPMRAVGSRRKGPPPLPTRKGPPPLPVRKGYSAQCGDDDATVPMPVRPVAPSPPPPLPPPAPATRSKTPSLTGSLTVVGAPRPVLRYRPPAGLLAPPEESRADAPAVSFWKRAGEVLVRPEVRWAGLLVVLGMFAGVQVAIAFSNIGKTELANEQFHEAQPAHETPAATTTATTYYRPRYVPSALIGPVLSESQKALLREESEKSKESASKTGAGKGSSRTLASN